MDAITALHTRNSAPKLTEPAPEGVARENIFKAALRAPDHARLKPARFLVLEGESRQRLGGLFAEALKADNPEAGEARCEKTAAKPLRAPLLVVVVAGAVAHPKVPAIEQLLSAGAAAQNMLVAAHAEGFGAIWRTGGMAYHPLVKRGLGLNENEEIVGYLYMGTVDGPAKPLPNAEVNDYFQGWTGN